MADPAPTGTSVPAPQGGGSPSPEFKVPDGKVLIDASEQQTWQRQREQLAGLTKFHGEATKRGLSRPEDFSGYDELLKHKSVFDKKGITLAQLAAGLAAEQDDGGGRPEGGLTLEAIEKQLGQKFIPADKFNDELDYRDAMNEHKQSMTREQAAFDKALGELAGERDGDFEKAALKAMLKGLAETKRGLYPDGHPLAPKGGDFSRAQLRAHDDKSFGEIMAEIKKLRTNAEASQLTNTGKEASRSARTTPAGATTPQGKPKDESAHQTASARLTASVERAMAGKMRGG